MLDSFLHGDYASAPTPLPVLALALLLAFLMGQLIAWIYMMTHDGLSYSRAFVVSLVLLPVTVALVMMVLANSLVTAFGLMAVFAVVRFRNILRDTLDTAASFGIEAGPADDDGSPFAATDLWQPEASNAESFVHMLQRWVRITGIMNEMSRAMGQHDFYPFVLPRPAVAKLHFIHCVVSGMTAAEQP
jgi:hypothetical protein